MFVSVMDVHLLHQFTSRAQCRGVPPALTFQLAYKDRISMPIRFLLE